MPRTDTAEWLSTSQVAAALEISDFTVRKRLSEGKWPGVRPGHGWRMHRSVVAGLAAEKAAGVRLRQVRSDRGKRRRAS